VHYLRFLALLPYRSLPVLIPPRILVVLCCFAGTAAATEAPIAAVVLYPGSATIERHARITPGMTELEIDGLPANFDARTIRVQADPGIQIGQVVTRDVGQVQSASTREAELEAQIETLQDKIAILDVDAKSAALVQKYLENLNGAGTSGDRQQAFVDARSMSTMLETIRKGGSDAFERIRKAEVQKRDLGRQIEALQRDLERLHTDAHDSRHITVQLAARQAGILRLSYQVSRAGWKPTYRASLDSSASTVELERLATVSQKTGEDWRGVTLKLATGQPRLSPQAPEPRPWLLTYRKPVPTQAGDRLYSVVPAPAPAASPMRSDKSRAATDTADNYIPPIIETQGNFATEFDVPSRVTLPSDGREISVTLSKQSVAAKQRLRAVPRIDKSAVVTAEAARPEGVWLPGDIQLFRDGGYVGSTYWDTRASEKLLFSFGRDDLIRVAVNRTEEQTGTVGLLSHQAERRVQDIYAVTSLHKKPVDLLMLEPSPVSTSDEVQVQTVFDPQPTITSWENRRGVNGWETTIAPGQTLKFQLGYTISYPKEGSTSGLP
jgi:uncharacterized protein (TIGR02231 family)